MTATLGLNRVRVDIYGEEVIVPNDNIAKLMYYLNCISTVIDYQEPNILTNFRHYARLDKQERQVVYELATLLDPQLFIDKGIFIVNKDLLPDCLPNKFVKITDETIIKIAPKSSKIAIAKRKILAALGIAPPTSIKTQTAKAISVAVGIAQPLAYCSEL